MVFEMFKDKKKKNKGAIFLNKHSNIYHSWAKIRVRSFSKSFITLLDQTSKYCAPMMWVNLYPQGSMNYSNIFLFTIRVSDWMKGHDVSDESNMIETMESLKVYLHHSLVKSIPLLAESSLSWLHQSDHYQTRCGCGCIINCIITMSIVCDNLSPYFWNTSIHRWLKLGWWNFHTI